MQQLWAGEARRGKGRKELGDGKQLPQGIDRADRENEEQEGRRTWQGGNQAASQPTFPALVVRFKIQL